MNKDRTCRGGHEKEAGFCLGNMCIHAIALAPELSEFKWQQARDVSAHNPRVVQLDWRIKMSSAFPYKW